MYLCIPLQIEGKTVAAGKNPVNGRAGNDWAQDAAERFLFAGCQGCPVLYADWRLESRQNPQAGKPALRRRCTVSCQPASVFGQNWLPDGSGKEKTGSVSQGMAERAGEFRMSTT
jgi:hypothetical protein